MIATKSLAAWSFVLLVLLLSVTNALLFTYSASTPLVAKDSWYFLDTFVREYFNYSLDITDFFAKRGVSDHAQPIQKLILLFHLRYFQLDFLIEAMFGVLFGIGGAIAALALVGRPSLDTWPVALGFSTCAAAIPALVLSLSSPEIFTWSLATLGLMLVGLAIGYFSLGAHVLKGHASPAWLLPMTLLLAIALDNLALGYVGAFVLLGLIYCLATREWRRSGRAVTASLVGALSYDLVLQPLLSPPIAGRVEGPSAAAYFLEHSIELWKLVWHPASSMFVSTIQLEYHRPFPHHLSALLPVLLIVLHMLFWVRLLRRFGRATTVDLACTGLLLTFYATIAAIAIGRVPTFGFDYLLQPRYYIGYLLGSIPILVSAARDWYVLQPTRVERVYRALTAVLAVLVLAGQWDMSLNSWDRFKYISEYTQRASRQMGQLHEAPNKVTSCADILTVCDYDDEKKRQLINLLVVHELNVFNKSFQMRHRLYPNQESIPDVTAAP